MFVSLKFYYLPRVLITLLQQTLDNKGYICPQCKQSYTPLDADKLMDFARGAMFCEICHAEVVDNEDAESVQGSKDRMQRFNSQMRFIREGLQKSEAMVLPQYALSLFSRPVLCSDEATLVRSFDVAAWIKTNVADSDKNKASSAGPGLKIAGADGARKEDDGIGVMMAMDKDEMTQRQERDAQAEIKRQQNAMPSWHLKSTITGELTALGIKENTREAPVTNGAEQMSNDDILKGLGVIGGGPSRTTAGHHTSQLGIPTTIAEDVKPVINPESDCTCPNLIRTIITYSFLLVYDQYYASLAAASVASSSQPTPTATVMGSSSAGSPNFPRFLSQLNDDDEEEDKKPNVEYLDSLNAYRKRSRSAEDIAGPSRIKATKLDGEVSTVNGRHLSVNGYLSRNASDGSLDGSLPDDPPQSQDAIMGSQTTEAGSVDDPVCYGLSFAGPLCFFILLTVNYLSCWYCETILASYG